MSLSCHSLNILSSSMRHCFLLATQSASSLLLVCSLTEHRGPDLIEPGSRSRHCDCTHTFPDVHVGFLSCCVICCAGLHRADAGCKAGGGDGETPGTALQVCDASQDHDGGHVTVVDAHSRVVGSFVIQPHASLATQGCAIACVWTLNRLL